VKYFTLLAGLVCLSFAATGAQASTLVKVDCKWEVVSQTALGAKQICKDGSVSAAQIENGYNPSTGPICNAVAFSGYSLSGTCSTSAAVYRVVPDPVVQACGPNSGYQFPVMHISQFNTEQANIAAKCGACGYSVKDVMTYPVYTVQAICK
jgi:hypothetical protein